MGDYISYNSFWFIYVLYSREGTCSSFLARLPMPKYRDFLSVIFYFGPTYEGLKYLYAESSASSDNRRICSSAFISRLCGTMGNKSLLRTFPAMQLGMYWVYIYCIIY